jgi:hypothetical protein
MVLVVNCYYLVPVVIDIDVGWMLGTKKRGNIGGYHKFESGDQSSLLVCTRLVEL